MEREFLWRANLTALIDKIECAHPTGENPEKQLAALHTFKHEVLAAFNRLYVTVPAATADAAIQRFLRETNRIVPPEAE